MKPKDLLLSITMCKNVQIASGDENHPCHEIVSLQSDSDEFQLPEPWSGNLESSKILFISSNPSIDESEAYPNSNWNSDDIIDFFKNRFAENSPWTEDSKRVLTKDMQSYAKRTVPYWNETKSMARDAFGRVAIPGVDYSLTEIVHCKSRSRKGVKSCAKTCFDLWMKDIIHLSNAKVLIILGDEAKEMISSYLEMDSKKMFHENFTALGDSKIVLFLPAPGSSKPRKISRVLNEKEQEKLRGVLN